jgi:hypothetical protein
LEEEMNKRAVISVLVLLAIYFASYIFIRQTHQQTWEKDNKAYVIFPENRFLYYTFRPMSILDQKLTGIPSHIGEHR